MDAESYVTHYNTIMHSHKRLTQQDKAQLATGTPITLYTGTHEQWTSTLTLQLVDGTCIATMQINEALPSRLVAQLREKKREFDSRVQS